MYMYIYTLYNIIINKSVLHQLLLLYGTVYM